MAGLALVVALTGAGLVVDRVDAQHPRRTGLAYLLDTDTGRARWVSWDADPPEWTRGYVTEPATEDATGFGDSPIRDNPTWTGAARPGSLPAPEVTLRSWRGDTVELHVSSPRSAPRLVLRIAAYDQTHGLAEVPGFRPRPPELAQPPRRNSDTVTVARSYEFSRGAG